MTSPRKPDLKAAQARRVKDQKGPKRQNWMTSTEMSALLGINPRTFRRWKESGVVPPPQEHTECGYGLWSPQQQKDLIKARTLT